jgi:monovalent cation/proton antiporter MnhG/PhaG subunit
VTVGQWAAQVLLWAGVAAELVCCLGVWWMRDVFDRLHYAAAATTLGPVLIGISAVLTGAGGTSGTIEVGTAAAVLVLVNPLVTHAMGRTARQLLFDDVGPRPEELADQDAGTGPEEAS